MQPPAFPPDPEYRCGGCVQPTMIRKLTLTFVTLALSVGLAGHAHAGTSTVRQHTHADPTPDL